MLALQHVGQRLERPVTRAGDRTTTTAVVEQGVDGLLEHPLLVIDNDGRCPEVQEPLEAVVPVDDPAVQVIQVGGCETTAVQLHHGTQFRRDDRDGVQDHGPGLVDPTSVLVPTVEGGDDLQPLNGLLLALDAERLLALRRVNHRPELDLFIIEVDPVDELSQGIGTHTTLEVITPPVL